MFNGGFVPFYLLYRLDVLHSGKNDYIGFKKK